MDAYIQYGRYLGCLYWKIYKNSPITKVGFFENNENWKNKHQTLYGPIDYVRSKDPTMVKYDQWGQKEDCYSSPRYGYFFEKGHEIETIYPSTGEYMHYLEVCQGNSQIFVYMHKKVIEGTPFLV